MDSQGRIPASSFWNSKQTHQFIATSADGRWEIPASIEPWKSLLAVMIETNNEEQFPRCSFCLFMFIDLFQKLGASLKKRWGPNWSDPVAVELQDDKLSLAFLKFFKEVVAVDRTRAQIAFRKVASKGLSYKMPGGHAGRYRSPDFGVEFLIELTGKIESILASQQAEEDGLDAKVIDVDTRRRMPLVILDWYGKDRISLQYQDKKVQLTPKQSKLVHALFMGRGAAVSYRDLWEELYDHPYESVDTGPPEALKTHKKDINKILREAFEPPPNRRYWIETQKLDGYVLNRSVKWQYAKEARDTKPEFFRPSREIDYSRRPDD